MGWGMITHAELPWNDRQCPDFAVFNKAREEVKKQFEFGLDLDITVDTVDGLLWRHYIVSFAVRYALQFADDGEFNMVEAGVADGLTAFFSLRTVREKRKGRAFAMHLYDSWGAMRKTELQESESVHIGNYSRLNIDRARKNLSEFQDHLIYHQGYIPESLVSPPAPPENLRYLHIDLNAALPTQAALEFFWPRLKPGGVILFDDYGWKDYQETREMIDGFFAGRDGILMKLPTGQAIYFR